MGINSVNEFSRMLGTLEGQDFEDAVCAFLQRCIGDFQSVPATPHGDGGLDGYSHGRTTAYCCYGPEAASKATAVKRKTAIVSKFRDDLRKLFELTTQGKKKLLHRDNAEIKTILVKGKKLRLVRLVVSVFDDHQILGLLNESFAELKAASNLRYVDKEAELTVWGPEELARQGAVDDVTLAKLEHSFLHKRLADTIKRPSPIPTTSNGFNAKFDWIDANGKVKVPKDALARTRSEFLKRWGAAIAVENELANNAVNLHSKLGQVRTDAGLDASITSGLGLGPMEQITKMRPQIESRLREQLGHALTPEIRTTLADGEIARLIGECSMDWRT